MKKQRCTASNIITMIIVTLIYAGFSSLIVLLLKTDLLYDFYNKINKFVSIYKLVNLEDGKQSSAYSQVFAYYILSFIPTYLYYLISQSPISAKRKAGRIVVSIIASLAVIGLDYLFFIKFKEFKPLINDSLIFEIIIKASLIASQILFLIGYIVWFMNPKRIVIGYGIISFKNKHPNLYIIIYTFLGFIAGIIITGLVILIIGLIALALTPLGFLLILGRNKGESGDSPSSSEYTFINSMGCEQTVHSDNGQDFYDSQGSYVGHSEDGGETIIED